MNWGLSWNRSWGYSWVINIDYTGANNIFSSIDLPGDNNDYYARVVPPVPTGLLFNDNGSFTWQGLSTGIHEFTVEILKNDIVIGSGLVRVNVS